MSDIIIREVKKNIDIPLIIGGGINDSKTVKDICDAGADIIVVGNAFEKKSNLIRTFADIIHTTV